MSVRRAVRLTIPLPRTIQGMNGGTLGGGILLVALALLWVVVLVPSWARNRQHRVAEQHAARIQRTVRLLAETADLPEEHVIEANAKQAFQQQKLLKEERQRQAELEKLEREKRRAEQRLAEYRTKKEVAMHRATLRRARMTHPGLKPVRLIAALAAILGALGVLVGAGMAIGGLGPVTLLASLAALSVGTLTLVALAPGRAPEVAEPQQEVVREERIAQPLQDFADEPEVIDTEAQRAAFDAHQERVARARERARAMNRARAHQVVPVAKENLTDSILLRERRDEPVREAPAAADASESAREPQPSVQPQLDVQAKSRRLQAQEKLRAMGVVGDTSAGATNLDEALRRRRNAS